MDSNPIPQLADIEDAIEAAGAWVLFLPAYSPDLIPIETCWAKGKSRLRSLKPRTLPALLDALFDAFSSITPQDILRLVSLCWLLGRIHLTIARSCSCPMYGFALFLLLLMRIEALQKYRGRITFWVAHSLPTTPKCMLIPLNMSLLRSVIQQYRKQQCQEQGVYKWPTI